MNSKKFYKEYIAIVNGVLENHSGTINLPIARKENSIIERCVDINGDKSVTHYEVLSSSKIDNCTFSVVKCILETGRTHQIRVHFSHIGHTLLSDTLYGTASHLITRQALHSYKLSFIHPITNECVSYISDLPKDFLPLIKDNSSLILNK